MSRVVVLFQLYFHSSYALHPTQQELHRRYEGTPESTKTKALQTVIDMKVRRRSKYVCDVSGRLCARQQVLTSLCKCQDAKINSMERSLRDMEEELLMLKSNGLLSCEERQEEMKQMEVYRSHTKFMKNKV